MDGPKCFGYNLSGAPHKEISMQTVNFYNVILLGSTISALTFQLVCCLIRTTGIISYKTIAASLSVHLFNYLLSTEDQRVTLYSDDCLQGYAEIVSLPLHHISSWNVDHHNRKVNMLCWVKSPSEWKYQSPSPGHHKLKKNYILINKMSRGECLQME